MLLTLDKYLVGRFGDFVNDLDKYLVCRFGDFLTLYTNIKQKISVSVLRFC